MLSDDQFLELATDAHDELSRRQESGFELNEGEFLQHRKEFTAKRNQSRQRLATMKTERFNELLRDVFFEMERRGISETDNSLDDMIEGISNLVQSTSSSKKNADSSRPKSSSTKQTFASAQSASISRQNSAKKEQAKVQKDFELGEFNSLESFLKKLPANLKNFKKENLNLINQKVFKSLLEIIPDRELYISADYELRKIKKIEENCKLFVSLTCPPWM